MSKKEKKIITKNELKKMSKKVKNSLKNSILTSDYENLNIPENSKNIKIYLDKEQSLIIEYEN